MIWVLVMILNGQMIQDMSDEFATQQLCVQEGEKTLKEWSAKGDKSIGYLCITGPKEKEHIKRNVI